MCVCDGGNCADVSHAWEVCWVRTISQWKNTLFDIHTHLNIWSVHLVFGQQSMYCTIHQCSVKVTYLFHLLGIYIVMHAALVVV